VLCKPATPKEIAGRIEALTVHYWDRQRDEASSRIYVRDWVDDMGEVPADILEAACVAWRRSDARFMPTPGQLLKLAGEIQYWREFYLQRAIRLLKASEG